MIYRELLSRWWWCVETMEPSQEACHDSLAERMHTQHALFAARVGCGRNLRKGHSFCTVSQRWLQVSPCFAGRGGGS